MSGRNSTITCNWNTSCAWSKRAPEVVWLRQHEHDLHPGGIAPGVETRAAGRCEYCRIHQDDAFFSFDCDHIIAEKHGGATTSENLAFTCLTCNLQKGSDIASLDEEGRLQPLFNPRLEPWREHFALQGARIEALTPIGQATLRVLSLNLSVRLVEREELIESGLYPVED